MRKAAVLLLVFTLLAPAISFACECCPAVESTSSHSQITSAPDECCPMIDRAKDRCGIEQRSELLVPFQTILIDQAHSSGATFSSQELLRIALAFYGRAPSLISSEVPLYLSNRVFRL